MRLPQDRILHIGTEFKDGKVNIVAEWQGELVRCKDCRYWQDNQEGHYPNESCPWDKGETPDEDDYCSFGERREP